MTILARKLQKDAIAPVVAQSKSLHVSGASSCFYETEFEIWAIRVVSTHKSFIQIFMGKTNEKVVVVVSALKS